MTKCECKCEYFNLSDSSLNSSHELTVARNAEYWPDTTVLFRFTSEHSPPHVAALGEGRGLDDFGGHPGVGSRCAHLGGLVPLSGQPEISDLQRQAFHAFVLYGLSQKDWNKEKQIVEGYKSTP